MTGADLLWHYLAAISTSLASEPKIIPIAEIHGVQYVLAWISASEERAMWLIMFATFLGREIYGFVKIRFGKVGKELESLKAVPEKIDAMEESLKELAKSFHKFERNIHREIQDEVKYAFEMADRRKRP